MTSSLQEEVVHDVQTAEEEAECFVEVTLERLIETAVDSKQLLRQASSPPRRLVLPPAAPRGPDPTRVLADVLHTCQSN